MTEFWKSTKKWHCKYCDIHIDDNAPSKQLHETGFRHIGNKERHLRNVYKTGEKKKKDADEEKREIDRLEKAAERAYALDLAAGDGTGVPPLASTSKPAAPPKPKDKFAGYTTAADLGIIDPDVPDPVDTAAEEAAAQAKLEGRVGQWSFVAAPSPPSPRAESSDSKRTALGAYAGLSSVPKGDHDDEARESREFKFVRKEKRPLNWGIDDDEAGEIKVKVKEKEDGLMAKKRKKEEEQDEARRAREQLVWKPVAWGSKLGEGIPASEGSPQPEEAAEEKSIVKVEDELAIVVEAGESKPEVEPETAAPATSMFKKRRGPPAGIGKKPKF